MDPHDGYDGSIVLDVLGQSQKILDSKHWSDCWCDQHHDHSHWRHSDQHSLQNPECCVRQSPEVVPCRWSRGCGVLVVDQRALDLLHVGAMHRTHRLHRNSKASAQSNQKHRTPVPVVRSASSESVRALPRLGQERSVLLDLPWSRCSLYNPCHLPDCKDQAKGTRQRNRERLDRLEKLWNSTLNRTVFRFDKHNFF